MIYGGFCENAKSEKKEDMIMDIRIEISGDAAFDLDFFFAAFFLDLPNNSNTSIGAMYPCLSRHLKYRLPLTFPSCLPFGSSNSTPTYMASSFDSTVPT